MQRPVRGAVNDLGNVIRRPQALQEDRHGGGAYRYTHGLSERPGVCGARFRRHAEYAGGAPGAAASGSTHRFTTAATASTTAGPTAGESTEGRGLLALRWHWQLLSVRRRRRVVYGVGQHPPRAATQRKSNSCSKRYSQIAPW